MDNLLFALEALVVVGAIVMGTRYSGVGLGLWGGAGVFVLVFVFGLEPGSPPVDAMLIILSVVLASATMQVAGGLDWMVAMAAKVIAAHPKQITLVAPLTAFLFSVGAGTSNILYPLLPVIYDLSYKNGVRPSRPLSLAVVATGVALACSPVSAAMAAMLTLTDVPPYNFELQDILRITLPAAIVGIVVTSFVVRRLGADLDEDPEVRKRIEEGKLSDPASAQDTAGELTYTSEGRNAALIFLTAVVAIVLFGLFKGLRPDVVIDGVSKPLGMTPIIEMFMFVAGTLIMLVCRPKVSEVPASTVFKNGMVSAIALFGLAWMTDTFIMAHQQQIVDTVGGWVDNVPWIFAFAVWLVCVLTTSQSTATRTIVPIGLASGIAPGVLSGMWAGAFAGIYALPTNGSQIAAANFDLSGTTKLGTKLVDHSFFVPMAVLTVVTVVVGGLLGGVLG